MSFSFETIKTELKSFLVHYEIHIRIVDLYAQYKFNLHICHKNDISPLITKFIRKHFSYAYSTEFEFT